MNISVDVAPVAGDEDGAAVAIGAAMGGGCTAGVAANCCVVARGLLASAEPGSGIVTACSAAPGNGTERAAAGAPPEPGKGIEACNAMALGAGVAGMPAIVTGAGAIGGTEPGNGIDVDGGALPGSGTAACAGRNAAPSAVTTKPVWHRGQWICMPWGGMRVSSTLYCAAHFGHEIIIGGPHVQRDDVTRRSRGTTRRRVAAKPRSLSARAQDLV